MAWRGTTTDLIEARKLRQLLVERRKREAHFPGVGDCAFTMLLQLGASLHEGRDEAVVALCIASHHPATTALRHIGLLAELGLIDRHADPFDGRRDFIVLTAKGHSALAAYLIEAAQPFVSHGSASGQSAAEPVGFTSFHSSEIAGA